MDRRLRAFTSHEAAKAAERVEVRRMTPEERLRVGAALHAFWVRNYRRNASRLDRTLRVVQRHRGEFLLVGDQAVIAHGYPRLTKDMGLWVRPTADNGARVIAASSPRAR